MTEVEKIRRYIDRHNALHGPRCDISVREALAIAQELTPVEAIGIAFTYGKTKGYRAAKRETRTQATLG